MGEATSKTLTAGIMDEATCISYNNTIEELRAKEYPMLQGKSHVKAR
jgi:hypothetical protein